MSFDAFLVVGPILIICLLIQLHMLVAEFQKYEWDNDDLTFNLIGSRVWPAAAMNQLALYWLAPYMIAAFAWKSSPRHISEYMNWLLLALLIFSMMLQIRRLSRESRSTSIPIILLTTVLFYLGWGYALWSRGPDLDGTRITTNILLDYDLKNASLRGSNIAGVKVNAAKFFNTSMHNVKLQGSELTKADTRHAKLLSSNMKRIDLSHAILKNADLKSAKLVRATLTNANLSSSHMNETNLRNSDLTDAILVNADVSGAIFDQTNLSGAKITAKTSFIGACRDAKTNLPREILITLPMITASECHIKKKPK
ncbi:MAG TPA: hypothetical protein TECP_00212 [Hyphomicrobiaceae bacterium MAG_BT-2024]